MSNARTPLMVGNWKLNLDHHQAIQLVQKLAWTLGDAKHDYDAVEVVVSPSFTSLRSVQTLVDGDKMKIRYGAQDLSPFTSGAYTGDISGPMIAKLGCSYVLAGHWHPCISVSGRAFERLRLPCFWLGDDSGQLPGQAVGILPAFGSFTGMHRIEPRAGDRIFPIAGDVVRALPALPVP